MTITQVISALPDAPDPAIDPPSVFSQKAAASVLAQKSLPPQLNAFAEQANAMANKFNSDATAASEAAITAASAAAVALSSMNVSPWRSGATYAQNDCVISQVNFQTYRKRTQTSVSTVDPASDITNWRLLSGNDSNGAFIAVPLTYTGIDLRLGNYFTSTVNSNTAFTIENCPAGGYSFTLEITHTAGAISFPVSVKTTNDVTPALLTGKTHLFMFVTVNGGARWRVTAAANYSN